MKNNKIEKKYLNSQSDRSL